MTAAVSSTISELDAMLSDLNSSALKNSAAMVNNSASEFGDYASDYTALGMARSDLPPARPPPPKASTLHLPSSGQRRPNKQYSAAGDTGSLRLPRASKPQKLQHILVKNRHELVKAVPRDDDVMRAPDFPPESDEGDYGESDYSKVADSIIPSDEELEKAEVDAGETPRGDKSMIIKTDYGQLKSKYRYKGFGLWENTEPDEPPPPPKKPSPPPPPPKAEPVWYNCTVSVQTHCSSKELDDLEHGLEGYERLPNQNVELGNAAAQCPSDLGELWEEFEKEDMSEMFRRAFLEKMALVDDSNRVKYKCYVCREWIKGRIITAMSHKFHPECFLCTYCRKEFKERTFKSDNDGKPYCQECFEKLLGHFGTARFTLKDLT